MSYLAASGLAASGLAASGLAASGLAASGLAASGLAASGLAASYALAQQPEPGAVFQTTTKLVEVSVIAEENPRFDKPSKPVTDLRREDFQILDNGVRQEIRLFITPAETTAEPEARPANGFTNHIARSKGAHSGYSAIVFDNLFTDFGAPFEDDGTGFGVSKVLQALAAIPPGERIAIYALGRKLHVIGEFTADREMLERRLRAWKPSPDDAKAGTEFCIPATDRAGVATSGQKESVASCMRNDSLQRQAPFDEEMKSIADHMAGIPGRKNLIWMANTFPISGGVLRGFIDAGVAMYTVDEAGVWSKSGGSGAPGFIAQLTGGVNYLKRNDLDVVVREAVEDGRAGYVLGFYQPTNDTNPFGADLPAGLHQITVRVNRPGIHLRYRASYRTETDSAHPAASAHDLIEALNRPVDATAIGITASATRTQDRLHLAETFDVSGLDLQLDKGLWSGRAEVVARFLTADGTWAGDVVAETLTLSLKAATYESALQNGLPYGKELTIPPKAVELKLLIGNAASGKIGTLTIPLSEVRAVATDTK